MRYDLIRLIMLQRERMDMFGRQLPAGDDNPREWWLRQVFAEQIAFQHYGNDFHFVPESYRPSASQLIIGRVGRPFHLTENLPPDRGLSEVERDAWKAAAVIIDPTAHDDGQKAAMQVDARVGRASSVFKSLAEHINARVPLEPFILETNPIVDPATFWAFEEENRDEITFISFELVAPNMFGTRNDIDQEMKDLRDHEKARKAKLGLENNDGLKLNTDRVRKTVNYTLEGGGNITARTKRKKTFNSKRKSKRVIVDDPPPELVQESFATKIGRAIARIFGS